MNQLSGRDLWLCRQRKCQRDLFAPKQKYKETNTLFHHPSFTVWWDFYRRLCGNCFWNKPPQDRMLQRYPSAIYGPLYKRHITISACLQSRIYSGFHVHWLTARWCMRGMERKGWRGTHKCRRREEKNIKRYECISCCYCCVPPAGVNSDQRPFIIWYCQNIKLYSAFN